MQHNYLAVSEVENGLRNGLKYILADFIFLQWQP